MVCVCVSILRTLWRRQIPHTGPTLRYTLRARTLTLLTLPLTLPLRRDRYPSYYGPMGVSTLPLGAYWMRLVQIQARGIGECSYGNRPATS